MITGKRAEPVETTRARDRKQGRQSKLLASRFPGVLFSPARVRRWVLRLLRRHPLLVIGGVVMALAAAAISSTAMAGPALVAPDARAYPVSLLSALSADYAPWPATNPRRGQLDPAVIAEAARDEVARRASPAPGNSVVAPLDLPPLPQAAPPAGSSPRPNITNTGVAATQQPSPVSIASATVAPPTAAPRPPSRATAAPRPTSAPAAAQAQPSAPAAPPTEAPAATVAPPVEPVALPTGVEEPPTVAPATPEAPATAEPSPPAPPTDTAAPTKPPAPRRKTAVPPTQMPAQPTDTPIPPTATLVPPTATLIPPTLTSIPPTATPIPPTDTPIQPSATPILPTDTPIPPTDMPIPPTVTPIPPTDTPIPPTPTPTPVALFNANINFQLDTAPVPGGYVPDGGYVYGARNGYIYGWNFDHSDVSRLRGVNPDLLLDTLVHFHSGGVWEIAAPSGNYVVTVSIGDPSFASQYTINVEGVSYWNNTSLNINQFSQKTRTVTVSDGRLTIDQGSAAEKMTRINYVQIVQQ